MIVGIDLGTTHSLIGAWIDGAPRLFPNASGSVLTPSCVSLDEDGTLLVGAAARERLVSHPDRTAAAFKRFMGTDRLAFLGRKGWRAEELSAMVLRALKADAEAALGQPVGEAVITVPAYFSDAQRKATRIAGELAGLKVDRLLNEPTAAALAYGLHESDEEREFIVLDLGGGTFDVSVLDWFEGVMEVRATAGDNFLGGEDFVDVLVAMFREAAPERLVRALDADAALAAQLRRRAEHAKRELSTAAATEVALAAEAAGAVEARVRIERDAFEARAAGLVARLRRPVERALRDARIRPEDLHEVVLAGGATRMPLMRRMASQLFGRLPAQHLDPDQVVALGAAVMAGLKARDAALREVVLTDVCPYTLGIEVSQRDPGRGARWRTGLYLPIIERNTLIPVSRAETVSTTDDDQTRLEIRIFQGESRLVKDNVELGALSITVPRAKAGEAGVEVRFTYDVDGLLEVDATSVETGERRSVVIEGNPGVLTPEQVKSRLAALAELKIHPRDRAENREALARADRIYQESLGEARAFVAERTAEFERAIDRQDPGEVAAARARLAEWLDAIERGAGPG